MPRYTNKIDGSLILHFGQGNIAVCTGHYADSGADHHDDELLFVIHQEPHEIGSRAERLEGKSTAGLGIAVRMVFDNVESLDVVIGQLSKLREGFPGAMTENGEYGNVGF